MKKTIKEKSKYIGAVVGATVVVWLYLQIAWALLLNALNENIRDNRLKEGYEWFSAYENVYILFCFVASFSIIFCILIGLIYLAGAIQLSKKDYSLECLRYRKVDDYTVEDIEDTESEGFFFRALDLDWDLHRLFAIDGKAILVGITVSLFCISLVGSMLTGRLNSFENDPTETWNLFSLLGYGFFGLIGIISGIFVIYTLISKTYNYKKIKNHVLETIESKLFLMDAFVSKPSTTEELSELEHLKVLQLQNKLYRIKDNLKQLPGIPITNWNYIMYGIAGLSALFSFFSVFLDQFSLRNSN